MVAVAPLVVTSANTGVRYTGLRGRLRSLRPSNLIRVMPAQGDYSYTVPLLSR